MIYAVDALVQPFWGSPRQDGSLQLNPLALAEPVYLFAELSRLIYEESTQKPKGIEYRIRFDRLAQGGKGALLGEGPLQPYFFGNGNQHHAPDSKMDRNIMWQQSDIDSAAAAYELIQEVYHWFCISDDGIPYTKKSANGGTVIDRDALIRAGAR